MKPETLIRHGWQRLIFGAVVLLMTSVGFAETNSVRLAIGPFFAPAGNTPLEKAASELPDLLTASLSQQNRFQLVEREKVNAIWNELHLAEAGLTSADTVGKLGRILSCDWLVSGSFVQTGSGAQIWVKVISTQDSVVLDLQAVPYNGTNFSATADAIAKFLAQTGSRSRPREFMALGKFEDRSISSTREDWSPRLVALIEKHFLAAGYGIVEREAMGPIFAEYQLQTAGLTGDSTNQVKLKPAFWIVDGGCKWIYDTQNKLSVTIRIRKMGGTEQELNFSQPPGDALEKAVVEAIQSALTNANPMTLEQMQQEEGKIRSAHVGELIKGRGETAPLHYSTSPTFITVTDAYGGKRQMQMDPAFLAQRESHAREALKTLQQAILLNPKDMRSKWMLGMSWYCSRDAEEKKQGQDLLEEVAASSDATYATKAKNWLADFKSGRLTLEPDFLGNLAIVTHGQPASIPADTNSAAQAAAKLAAWTAKINEVTNIATRAQSVAQLSALPEGGGFNDITAVKFWKRIVLIACGTTLQSYDLDANSTHEVGLPIKLKNSISAIEADTGVLWLGTGDGLIRVSLADGTAREFGEKDGFPTPAITALHLAGGRLFIGFTGAFGYLDTSTAKFTGLMAGANIRKDWARAMQEPPEGTICSITTLDGTNFWISSEQGFQHFDFKSKKWSLATSGDLDQLRGLGENTIALNSRYLALPEPARCVAVCRPPETNWTCFNLSTDFDENVAFSLTFDPANPDYLWIGGSQGKVTLLDVAASQIIAQGKFPSDGMVMVRWIFSTEDKVVIIAGAQTYNLYRLDKSAIFGTMPVAKAAKLNEITKVAVKSEHPVPITQNPGVIAYLNDGPITACNGGRAFGKGQLLVACGTILKSFNWSGAFGFGSGKDFEKVNLPLKVEYPITAIASDKQDLWLGTDGGGLIRIPQSGAAPTVFNEKNGFPMSSIRSLALIQGRLLIGFGHGMDVAFGYLDTSTLKFTGTKPSGISLKTTEESLQPPPRHSVWQMKTPDGTNTFWIACDSALYRLKFDSQEWSLQLPSHNLPGYPRVGGFKTLATWGNFVATIMSSGGVGIYNVPEDRWTHLNLSTNRTDNDITTLGMDSDKPNYLWLGGHGKITALDMNTQKIVCECPIAFHGGAIEFMAIYSGDVFFIEEESGSYELLHWKKPNLP
jgi:hypothetical protein